MTSVLEATMLPPRKPLREREDHDQDRGVAVVIDDEVMVLRGLTMVLEQMGWLVVAAESGEAALDLVHALGRDPDVIVADYRLRGDHTGVEAINALVEFVGRPIPAFLLTGDTYPDRLREAKDSGFTLLHKPVSFKELDERLSAVVPAR